MTADPHDAGLDRNLLFGQAALHLELLTTDQLRNAMMDLVDAPEDRSLSQILVQQGVLTLEQVLVVLDEIGADAGEEPRLGASDDATFDGQSAPAGPLPGPVEPAPPSKRAVTLSDTAGGDVADRLVGHQTQAPGGYEERYHTGNLIGQGGMGKIVLVKDRQLRREVVMKQMLADAQTNPLKVHRFIEEAQITSQLEHPNIVPVHELGSTSEGEIYFTMKRVSGEDLGHVIKELAESNPKYVRRYSMVHRLNLFLSMCNAVGFAHSKGVIHRDLKPENVMVGEFGELLVMDWGLAKLKKKGPGSSDSLDSGSTVTSTRETMGGDISRTVEGAVMGTPKYMAPEQAKGKNDEVDERTDIYSLGAILFELLTLRPPFEKGSIFEVMVWVAEGQFVPPGDDPRDPPIPRELVAIVMKAMATEKAHRYRNVQELAEDIEAYQGGYSVSAHRDNVLVRTLKWAQRNKAAATGLVAGLLALVAGGFAVRTFQRAQVAQKYERLISAAEKQLKAANYEEARTDATKALGIFPDSEAADLLLRRAIFEIAKEQQLKRVSEKIGKLRLRLGEERIKAAKFKQGEDRRAWYEAQTTCLNTARELARMEPESEEHPRTIGQLAREMAHQLIKDGSFEMASLRIDEAEASGLEPGLVKMDRWQLREARNKQARRSVTRARKLLAAVRSRKLTEQEHRDYVARLMRIANNRLVGFLVPLVFSSSATERQLAIETLGRIGDASTQARVAAARVPLGGWRQKDSPFAAELAKLTGALREKWLPGMQKRRKNRTGAVKLDAVQALGVALMGQRLDKGSALEVATEICWALGRLRDPRVKLLLALERWQSGQGSLYWRLTEVPYRMVPMPEQPKADVGAVGLDWALALAADGKTDDALKLLDAQISKQPAAVRLYLARGQVRQLAGLLGEAITDYDEAIKLDAGQATAYYLRGVARQAHGVDQEQVLADLGKALSLRPRYALALLGQAEALRHRDPAAATKAVEQAVKLDPFLARAQLLRGQLAEQKGDQGAAIGAYSEALRLDPGLIAARLLRGRLLVRDRNSNAALADFEYVIRARPGDARPYYYRARMKLAGKDSGGAIEDLDLALARRPRWLEARQLRAELYMAHRNFLGAIEDLSVVLKQEAANVGALVMRAEARAVHGDQDGALEDLGQLIQLEPKRVASYVARAEIFRGKRLLPLALADLQAALKMDPKFARAHFLLGRIALDQGKLDEAIRLMTKAHALAKAAKQDPEEIGIALASLLVRRASGRMQGNDLPGATADFGLAVTYNPRHWQAWVNYGVLLARAGKKAQALEALSEGRKRAHPSGHQEIDKLIEQVKSN